MHKRWLRLRRAELILCFAQMGALSRTHTQRCTTSPPRFEEIFGAFYKSKGMAPNSVVFKFNGETIVPDATPDSLEMKEGDVVYAFLPRISRVVDAPSLGQGSNFRASLCEYSGAQCVVKSLMQDAASADPRVLASVNAELRTLASLPQHPNVLRFFGVCSDRGRGAELVLQLAEGGSLTDFATGFPGGMPLPTLARYAAGVARGLAHLHAHGVSHNDLKPDNVLLDGAGTPLLADFGTSRVV